MTDQEGSVSYQKPPRPVPFGNKVASDSNLTSSLCREQSTGELSTDSREVLRQELRKRRRSLTPQEQGFLEELIIHGKEVEVTVAHQRLCDDDLFFDNDWGDGISLGTSEYPASDPGPGASVTSDVMERILHTSERLTSSDKLGSAKRQERLHQRRNSITYGKIWKAHEHGVPITGMRQRSKSIACLREEKMSSPVRRSSFLSAETADLLANGGPLMREGEDGIFRRTEEDVVFRKSAPTIPKGRRLTPSGRKVSWDRAGQATKPKRPILRRLASEGSRKSVSFAEYDAEDGDHPTRLPGVPRRITRKREVSTDTVVSELGTDLGDDDDASFPSLKHPHPVRSDSVSSIPSLHHPTAVRSASMSSIHSIHHAHHVHSETSVPGVDTSMSDASLMSIPSLHHGYPVRDEASLASFLSSSSPPEKESREPAWADPLRKLEEPQKPQLLRHPSQPQPRPVLLRRASRNIYDGEGIEVENVPPEIEAIDVDSISKARKYKSMMSFEDTTTGSVLSSNSFDQSIPNRDAIFRDLRRSLSDEGRSKFFLGSTSPLSMGNSYTSINTLRPEEDDASWDMETNSPKGYYDAWNVLTADPSYGAGRGNTLSFRILGTSADDEASTPHVLSPPLMDSLRNFFPYSLSESNFWMKFSLLRDGASFHSLLQNIRGATYTVIAVETVDGEVFGSFTAEPWRKNWKYFGNGESFLWRMRQSRNTPCFDIFDQAKMESELDVYPWAGGNDFIQLCTHDKIAVGGGSGGDEKKNDDASSTEYGFGLAIEKDLLYGTSTSCATFSSPPLSQEHRDGSPFEIVNLEVWALTPCDTLKDAEKLELGQLFLRTTN